MTNTIKSSLSGVAETLSAPLGELIAAVGRGVADAQQALDEATIEATRRLYTEDNALLTRIGYQPTWYRIPEVNAEISISLSISGEGEVRQEDPKKRSRSSKIKLYAAPVDASYTNTYDYDFKAASVIRFKIVAVPPSPQASELRIVPALVGKKLDAVKALLERLGIAYQVEKSETHTPTDVSHVKRTVPEAGELLEPGQVVLLTVDR